MIGIAPTDNLLDVGREHQMCPRCEARPGQPCTTMSGGRVTGPGNVHAARVDILFAAYTAGRVDAMAETRAAMKRRR